MATHSSILAWRIPWTEEPDGLQSMGSQRVTHDRVTFTSLHSCSYVTLGNDPVRTIPGKWVDSLRSKFQLLPFPLHREILIPVPLAPTFTDPRAYLPVIPA